MFSNIGRRDMTHKILRLPEVKKITGLGRSSIYSMMEAGTFPRQIPLGMRAVGWLESEIKEWIEQRAGLRQEICK